ISAAMAKLMTVLLVAIVAVHSMEIDVDYVTESEWILFKTTHDKSYETEGEETTRKLAFMENKRLIAEHNEKFERGEVTYEMGLNEYSDMSAEEFNRVMNGFILRNSSSLDTESGRTTFIPPANVEIPNSFDWGLYGAVTGVKNQGKCGSCWAFSATGALEGQHFRKTGRLISLSEQNLLDCSKPYGTHSCNGGKMNAAFRYIKDNHGIDTEQSYPYEARNNNCRYRSSGRGAFDTGYADLKRGDVQKLKVAIATVGPIAIAIQAKSSFQHYRSGVYYEPNCKKNRPNHAVLAVGYGPGYILVKNSWGENWGEGGYIKMSTRNNQCGLANYASYPR
ncbi:Cathepsin L, partial [Pseudolycoriella hygida]